MHVDHHIVTSLSVGAALPLAMLARASLLRLQAIRLADLVDAATLEPVLAAQHALLPDALHAGVELIPGVCLAHVPPGRLEDLVAKARTLGAQQVAVYGETLGDHVARGTNLAAIEAGADVVLHPGLITLEETTLAAANNVALELCGHPAHCLANGHVAAMASRAGARVVVGSGARAVDAMLDRRGLECIRLGAGASR